MVGVDLTVTGYELDKSHSALVGLRSPQVYLCRSDHELPRCQWMCFQWALASTNWLSKMMERPGYGIHVTLIIKVFMFSSLGTIALKAPREAVITLAVMNALACA